MIPEVKALEPQLKQILYGCVEHVQATKAALYLSSSYDLNDKKYELVTHYRFADATRNVLHDNDDVVDRLFVKRGPFFVNGLGTDQRFSEMLFRQSTDRLLVTPLFARGRLIGFIDMRDKAARKPFDTPDVDAAKKIADDIMALLGSKNLFGAAPIALVDDVVQRVVPSTPNVNAPRLSAAAPSLAAPPLAAPPLAGAVPAAPRTSEMSPAAQRAIAAAREIVSKRQLTHNVVKHTLTDHDLEIVRLLLPASLAIPGAVIACFSAMGHVNNPQAVVAIATVTDDAMEMLQAHLQAWLKRTNQPQNEPTLTQLIYPFGVQVVPVSAAGISTILSAPVNAQSVEGLVLTVAFERTPEAQAQRALHIFLRQIEHSVEAAIGAGTGRDNRQLIAERLLEPDFQKYPDLVEHCRLVSVMAQRFAILCELPPQQVEVVRLAALVHDVGLRLLDYERLQRRASLTAEEQKAMAEHPIIGAALVEPLLGGEVAQAVLRHHERVDGKGYPSRLTGAQIPMAARIIQICDAWVAMTSTHSYQLPVSADEAIQRLRDNAGTQFDEQLVARFLKSRSEIGA